ncbi:MAG TPA: hypothetical protein VIG30_02565 [Ktedonobacterales bacterium]
MSKQYRSSRPRATGQLALTHRQRRRPRGEVYRQAPRVRTRTQLGVESLEIVASAASDTSASALATDAALVTGATTSPLAPPVTADTPMEPGAVPPITDGLLPSASLSSARLPRRTRTLADVVQPRRDPETSSGPLSNPSLPALPAAPTMGPLSDPAPSQPILATADLAASADAPGEPATDEAATAVDMPFDSAPLDVPDGPATDPQDGGDTTEADTAEVPARPPLTSIPVPTRARLRRETAPIAALADPAADVHARARAGDPWGANAASMKDDDEVPGRFRRVARRGSPALARRVALGHAVAGVVLAVVASALVLLGQPVGVWLLALAGLAVASGGLAALLVWWWRTARAAVVVLALAQMGALAWGCALVGPRAALLVLAVPAVALALRAGGRRPALICGAGMVAVYGGFQIAASQALRPVFAPPPLALAAGETLAVALGVALLLGELLVAAGIRARSEAAARARLYEIRLLRERIGALRGEIEDGGERLDEALARALRGRGLAPIAVAGPLSQIAGSINAAAERLRTLQRDREDRLRLESAVRALARALERGWLGMPWTWPEPSGTLLDEVVVLLRTPRPADSLAELRASPLSGPLAPPPDPFGDADLEWDAPGAGVFGSGADWNEPVVR